MRKYLLGLIVALIVSLSCLGYLEKSYADAEPVTLTKLMFPCNAKAVSRIWIDEEIFWDAERQGLMMLEECDMLELNVDWSESIVVEWFATSSTGEIMTMRFRLFRNGVFVPEKSIPTSRKMDV